MAELIESRSDLGLRYNSESSRQFTEDHVILSQKAGSGMATELLLQAPCISDSSYINATLILSVAFESVLDDRILMTLQNGAGKEWYFLDQKKALSMATKL